MRILFYPLLPLLILNLILTEYLLERNIDGRIRSGCLQRLKCLISKVEFIVSEECLLAELALEILPLLEFLHSLQQLVVIVLLLMILYNCHVLILR